MKEFNWCKLKCQDEWFGQVILFRRQYLQLVEPKLLPYPAVSAWRTPDFQSTFFHFILSDDANPFLPPSRYRLRVLKRVVDDLQKSFKNTEEDEISDDILLTYSNLLQEVQAPEVDSVREENMVIYTLPNTTEMAPEIKLLESRSLFAASGTTGMRTWDAALHLGIFFCTSFGRGFVYDKRILELGAGTGFLSILCACHLGASHVLVTDGYDKIVDGLRANLSHNCWRTTPIEAAQLWWGSSSLINPKVGSFQPSKFDLVIGADVIYDPELVSPLVITIDEAFTHCSASKAIISATVRNKNTIQVFLDTCASHFIAVEEIRSPQANNESQYGFFHSTSIPIGIFLLSRDAEHLPE